MLGWRRLGLMGILAIGGASSWINCAFAQSITLDGSLGISGTLTGPNYVIEQSLGQTVGNNLFHSFGEFNLNSNEAAIFQSNPNIQNIISRVTGSNQSFIDGLIRTQNSGVNLFFINPSGILFGQNARLDVGGSFVASTANALQFGNSGFFSVPDKNVPSPLLTINPSAFLFTQLAQNAAIQNNSIAPAGKNLFGGDVFGLRVPDGQSLLLVGGNININGGRLIALGGQVELGGLAGEGTVGLNGNGNNLRLSFPDGGMRADVLLTNAARVDTIAANAGSIIVNARNIEILDGSWLITGIAYGLGSSESQAGNLVLNATGLIQGEKAGRILNIVDSGSKGNAGNINITAESLSLNDGTQMSAATFGQGNAGNINIEVQKNIVLNGIDSNGFSSGVFSSVEKGGVGKGGNINITTDSLSLTNGASLNTNTLERGDTGNITVHARKNISLDGVGSNGTLSSIFNSVSRGAVGKGGEINLKAENLSVTNGAQIGASTFGQGNAGDINIEVQKNIVLNGIGSNGFSSGVFSAVADDGVGKGGNITVTSDSLSLTNGARLETSTFERGDTGNITVHARNISLDGVGSNGTLSGIFNDVLGDAVGKGGEINLKAENLSVTNGAQISTSTFGEGNAGNINIDVQKNIVLNGISSTRFSSGVYSAVGDGGVGKGGNITVTTDSLSLTNGARLETSTFERGDTGNITVHARNISLDGVGSNGNLSAIFNNVLEDAVGKGGEINLKAENLSVTNGAQIGASTFGEGNAGNINIDVQKNIVLNEVSSTGFSSGVYSAVGDGGVGKGGNITVTSDSLSLTNGARLETSTFERGDTGNITVHARKNISLDGVGSNGNLSGIFNSVLGDAVGKGGEVNLKAENLSVTNGAQIGASTFGEGNAGNINIDVQKNIVLNGIGSNGFSSGVFSAVADGGVGKGGNITVTTDSLSLTNGARLETSTFERGDTGNITVHARKNISLDGVGSNGTLSGIFNSVLEDAVGKGGEINLKAENLSVTNGAQIIAATFGKGNAGNISIDADTISLQGVRSDGLFPSGIFSGVENRQAVGNGGNITLNVGQLFLNDGGLVSASTLGKGNTGDIIIKANEILLNGVGGNGSRSGVFNDVLSGAIGNGGNITVSTGSLSASNGARLSSSTSGLGNAGNVKLKAKHNVSLDGTGTGFFTNVRNRGNGGNVTVTTDGSLFVNNGARLSASTFFKGNAGNVNIDARQDISFNGIETGAFSQVGALAEGNAGKIDVTTGGSLFMTNGAVLISSTLGRGNAGSITINADDKVSFASNAYIASEVGQKAVGNAGGININTGALFVTDRAFLSTTTQGQGNAGSIIINARNNISLSGSDRTGIFSRVRSEAREAGGKIFIFTDSLSVADKAQLSTSNIGQGSAGDIGVTARTVRLDTKGTIQATTFSGNGGNITLNVQDLLLLRHGSQISTTAGTAESGGDGGNIIINNLPNYKGFIIAVPSENSDITANAYTGRGGNVRIVNTQGIFGIEYRRQETVKSDITASSTFGESGTVSISNPNIDPRRGLVELPISLVDPFQQIAQDCTPRGRNNNRFVATGRSGLPLSPYEVLQEQATLAPWITLEGRRSESTTELREAILKKPTPEVLVEAQGWVLNSYGEVELVAQAPSTHSSHSLQFASGCWR
jgi:filamentous hemagglutinin family protein